MQTKKLDQRIAKRLESLFAEDLHARRILSLSSAAIGAVHGASLGIHAIGRGLAAAKCLNPKHTIKQVDRLLSNQGIDPWALAATWVPFVIASRTDIVVALDWTDFDSDNQSTIALHIVTSHGRTTPLLWRTVVKSELADWRNEYEDQIIQRLHEVLPKGVRVVVLADRGFGDQKLYALLKSLGFEYVIRFREIIQVTDSRGESKPGTDWVPANGRPKLIRDAKVTQDKYEIGGVVCVKARGMDDAWCLATSLRDASASVIVGLYGKRFTIEEQFRDSKNLRFGLGLGATHIGRPDRRDRLFLIGALATTLLTLLGAAGESLGMDRLIKANTVKRRTHSLFRQGLIYYDLLGTMQRERLEPLMVTFDKLLREHRVFHEVFGLI